MIGVLPKFYSWRKQEATLVTWDLEGKNILLTGGTGSFGSRFVPMTLERYNPKKLVIFSRDEMKQWAMASHYSQDPRVRFFIGDVRDKERLYRAFDGIDVVVHAAATKIVPTAEYNPFEAVKTNVIGAMNVIDAALDMGVQRVVALSTDKASSPVNLYGATKMTSDKLFIAANNYSGSKGTKFSVVRYGNVMGSRGSVIPHFLSLGDGVAMPITDPRMTRFMITLEQGVDLVWSALISAQGGEIFVKKIPSMNIMDIASAVRPDLEAKIVGIRPGEKLHEQMISPEDSLHTVDCGDHYRIMSNITKYDSAQFGADWEKVPVEFNYSSDNNQEWMSVDQLASWVKDNRASIGKY
jgi:UDP-N-acetylglucosamine 4,6-dehydratase (inverting)